MRTIFGFFKLPIQMVLGGYLAFMLIADQLMCKHFLCLLWICLKQNEKQICMSPYAAS